MATKEKLVKVDGLWKESANLNKKIKAAAEKLEADTIAKIGALTDEEAKSLLQMKWIEPMFTDIMGTMDDELKTLEDAAEALAKKYAESLYDIEQQLTETEHELAGLINELTGDEYALKGLNGLVNLMKK